MATTVEQIPSNVSERSLHGFSWIDHMTPNLAQAQAFYGELFGWTWSETSPEFNYGIAQRGGNDVAGIMESSDTPPCWTAYVYVADASASAARAKELGATILTDAFDVGAGGSVGRMAVIQDPQGAVFGLWQPGDFHGADLVNTVGAFSWIELRSADVQASIEFYSSLFGWTATKADFPGMDYWTLAPAGTDRPLGGLMIAPEGTPTHWSITIGVEDADAAAAQVRRDGGEVVFGPVDSQFGRALSIVDPHGARLGLIQPPADG